MAIDIPDALMNLDANCGVFAVWMLLQHHGIQMNIADLAQTCRHDAEDGTFTIALAIALKKLGFEVSFYTAPDPNIEVMERQCYQDAQKMQIPIEGVLSYSKLRSAIENGKMAIVYYDTLDGIGNQSLVYSIDDQDICFFDSFEPMPKHIFEQQRHAEGICAQVILIDDRNFVPSAIRSN
ncbi:cysteine peptidase family C39 domain-containing protein [Acinetobacter sp. MD2]|uniref:cysteine peptidase family C39 domain-containing protein n=1 Tax=Acinetobacter sp. MD2 TaxID=2600066 RepID=UPI002D1EB544|nr:cysteine peptidase family C39 domain-containing protein [Acinetobacter sp. MD2]MEB3767757.1 peptidase C39 [Acinetobacter sp. MD2]